MHIGILGGSFNPPHLGHLALARAALDTAQVDAVLLIPAASPPHKKIPLGAEPEVRLAMAELLAAEDARLAADALELRRPGNSYTIDTVRELRERHPGDSHRLIIGSDMAQTFSIWREYRELLRLAPPLVAERPDFVLRGASPEAMFPGLPAEDAVTLWRGRFAMPPVDVNSTMVRSLVAAGAGDAALLPLVPSSVLRFIRERGLYAAPD